MSSIHSPATENAISTAMLPRNDPVNRWGNLISTYLALPGLRGFWPMSVIGASGQAVDLALQNHMTDTASPPFGHNNFVPYAQYNGSTQYHSIADNAAHDIIGNESYIGTGSKGLTIGMWANPRNLPGGTTRIFAKGTTTGNAKSYHLAQSSSNIFVFGISSTGANTFDASAASAFSANQWYFLAGRFTPSTEIKLWVGSSAGGLETFTNTSSIPATLNNSATGLAIGAQADGTQYSSVWASMCFVSVMALDDYFIFSLFEQGKTLYGI